MGRPAGSTNKPKTSLDNHLERTGTVEEDPRNPNAEVRPPRIRMGSGLKLKFPGYRFDRKNFYYRCFAEHPSRAGRLLDAEAAYYEYCTGPNGEKLKVSSGAGFQYLMRLPMEFRTQDVEVKRQKNRAIWKEQVRVKEGEYAPTKHKAEGGDTAVVEVSYTENPFA